MAGRRSRIRARPQSSSVPASPTYRRSSSRSFWYCDFKIYYFNEVLFNLGWRYSRFLKVWFSVGACFCLIALVVISTLLIFSSTGNFNLKKYVSFWLDTFFSPGRRISILDLVLLIFSTLISIAFHEIGHAISASSEGLQIEYIAIFLAVLFPGALVALNYDFLHNSSPFSSLRIYCAGIWHNLVFCAGCLLAISLLPSILYPFYTHNQGLIILGVPKDSTLSNYIPPHSIITSIDGSKIKNSEDFFAIISQNKSRISPSFGFCVPNSWIDASSILTKGNNGDCLEKFSLFKTLNCGNNSTNLQLDKKHCLIAGDVAVVMKCSVGDNCACLKEELCVTPVQFPGMYWTEISYSKPYASKCVQNKINVLNLNPTQNSNSNSNSDSNQDSCGGSFVHVGDTYLMARNIKVSSYLPRIKLFISLSAYIPYLIEKALVSLFHVSVALSVVNCLPVYYLDGESILEMSLYYFTRLTRRQCNKFLRFCLFGGTVLSIISFLRILF
ncbi:hypothetical protein LUZ60_011770 [Juncus effusus]|nr:hypothetical protein LUZ60_011770 [Juncus effusus]